MAGSTDKIIKYGVGGVVIYTLYGLALQGSLGDDFKKAAYEVMKIWKGTPGNVIAAPSGDSPGSRPPGGSKPATGIPLGSQGASLTSTILRDFDGVPVAYDTARGTLQQDPEWVRQNAPGRSPNIYQIGDVFKNQDGFWFQIVGPNQLVAMDGGQRYAMTDFALGVA